MSKYILILNRVLTPIKQSEFIRSATTLATGTSLAQAVSLLTAPVLYRIYSREDYGTLGLYMAVVGVMSVFSTLQYSQTILLEKEDATSKIALWLTRILNITISVCALMGIYLFQFLFPENEYVVSLGIWLYLIPVSIFFLGQNEIFRVWANRKREYKMMRLNTLVNAIVVPVFSISLGFLIAGAIGLFVGLLASQISSALVLYFSLNRKYQLGWKGISPRILFNFARKNYQFPLYNVPSSFLYRFAAQLPVFMLSKFAGIEVVGLYNLGARMLSLPSTMLSNALGEVFRQRATKDYNELGSARGIFKKTFLMLLVITIIPTTVVLLYGPELFSFFFGDTWKAAGLMAQVLTPFFAIQLIVSPLTYLFYIANKLKENVIIQLYILISSYLIFYYGYTLDYDTLKILLIYAINYSLVYVYFLIRSFQFSKNPNYV